MTSVGEDTIETAALGRPFQLGMLYDCRKDTLIPGITLWNREQLQQNKDISSQVNTEFSFTASDTIEEKSKHMKVDGELKLSLLGGNVQLSGAARYFNDTKKSFKQERVTLHYRTTCRFEQLTMNHLAQGKMDHHEVFDLDVATHVVTAVLYGADAYFVFDKMVNLSEDGSSAEGEGGINLDNLKKVFSAGDAHLTLNMNENEKGELKNLSCTFYGDFQLPSNPSTFEDAVKVYTDLPKLIGKNSEHAVAVKVWLFPLVKLDRSAGKLQRHITTDLIRAVESVFEALNVIDMKCSDLLQDTVAKTFSTFHNQVQHLQKFCSEYKKDFIRKLSDLLPEIRGGKTDIKHLTELLEAHEKSPFNKCDLLQWITVKEKKSNQLKVLLKQLCDLGAEVTDDIERYLLDLNVENLVAYAFTCLQDHDPFLTKQKIYLNPSTIKTPSENTHDLGFQEKSWTSKEIMCMKKELKMFRDLIALNKSQTTKFIVQSIPQASPSTASCILLYENGCSEAVCFAPPSKPTFPTIQSVTENSITVKLSPSCSATLQRKLLYKMKQDNDWKSQPVHQDIITLTDLQENNDYEIKCAAEGKLDYIVESDVMTVSTKESQTRIETTQNMTKLRLMLLGSRSVQTAVKNIILGREDRNQAVTPTSTQQSENTQGEVAGRKVIVMDTPDWFSPGICLEERLEKLENVDSLLHSPGPHAFLLVLHANQPTGEKKSFIEEMVETLGASCWQNTMIIFIVPDKHQRNNQSEDQKIQKIFEKSGKEVFCLNIKESGKCSQVADLLEKIEKMVNRRGEKIYSSDIYKHTLVQVRKLLKSIKEKLEKCKYPIKRDSKEKMRKLDLPEELQQKMEMKENEHKARTEEERNIMKIILPELWKNILESNVKMHEKFSRQEEGQMTCKKTT